MYTVPKLKEMGKLEAMKLLDKLESINGNLDWRDDSEGIIYSKNCDIINLIEQIYIYKEI